MKRKKVKGFSAFLVLMALIALLIWDGNRRIVTDKFEIVSERIPESLDGYTIVQLSDLHEAEFGENNEELFEAVRACAPNIIAITGDLVDQFKGDESAEREYMDEVISGLLDIAPVFFVTGNHEWATGWGRELTEYVSELGARVLRNEYTYIMGTDGSRIILAGVDDPNGPYDMKTPEELVSEIREAEGDRFILLLAHRNDRIATWSALNVDAVLCGHAHGGVIRLPFTDGLIDTNRKLFPSYTSGIYTEGATQMMVSRGLGNGKNSFRVLNPPQVAVITLKRP